jgi:hypothetical protein
MFEVHKRYILDESHQPIAVQIPIDQFEQIEKILEGSSRVIVMKERQDEADETDWLEGDLANLGSYESYDWQPDEKDAGLPVKYVPGRGIVIEE